MLSKQYQSGDWKGEKHVPFISAPESVKAGEKFEVRVHIGEADGHPNTLEHHIGWMKLYYQEEGGRYPVEVGTFNFSAHGEFNAFTDPQITAVMSIEKSGQLYASSYCNIHGLWENAVDIKVE